MKVFKFGGASVKDANGVINLARILKQYADDDTVVVVSAMGKMTNAFETVIYNVLHEPAQIEASVTHILEYHNNIIQDLFVDKNHSVFTAVSSHFKALNAFINANTATNYNFVYDQIIGFGELLSTTIVSAYLRTIGVDNSFIDVRDYIITDSNYRRANVDWEQTCNSILPLKHFGKLLVTQGFLGSDSKFTTTLGREGSDYTAAIFAYALEAESVSIWKDVPGVLNADPRYFPEAQLLEQVSYTEAIELAFYGASVIHPKTLQPLQKKGIPLYVKSFLHPEGIGTSVNAEQGIVPQIPCYIVKKNQLLISMSSLDFSYIVEENISEIFSILHRARMKVDLIQNSAISFSICVEDNFNTITNVLKQLEEHYKVALQANVALYTVRHYTEDAMRLIETNKNILLKQRTQDTLQIVTK